jgi:ferric-dicitrate binding protein FerR (iron transport regulator)
MNPSRHDEAWIERATALLDRSAENLDAATLSKLNRARQAALSQRHAAPRRWLWGAGLAGAVAAVFALALGVHHGFEAQRPASTAPLQAGDIDLLTSDEDTLDLSENLDFYAWLEAHKGDPSG